MKNFRRRFIALSETKASREDQGVSRGIWVWQEEREVFINSQAEVSGVYVPQVSSHSGFQNPYEFSGWSNFQNQNGLTNETIRCT